MTHTLLLDIWVLARLAGAAMDDAVAPSGLAGREFVLYALMAGLDGATPTELARRSGVPATTISKMLRRMSDRGHVVEEDNPEDARSRLLRLSAEGDAALDAAHDGFAALTADVVSGLGDEVAQIEWSLGRLRSALGAGGDVDDAGSSARPASATAHSIRYAGRPLTVSEEREVADYIEFLRRND